MKAREDLDIDAVRAALSGRVIGGRLLHHDVLSSTMDEARLLASEGWSEGLVVVADQQTAGRGRFDRNWISPPGENLSFSVLLRPTAAELSFVNMAATLAVSKTVAELTGRPTAIKWPNDVKIGGRKVSGILIETDVGIGKLRYAILGIGINVNLDPAAHPEIASIATSLSHELRRRVNRGEVLQSILERFDDMYGMVKRGRSLTDEWSEQLETLGRSVSVRWGHRVIEGQASVVDQLGHLVVVMADGSTVTVAGGEVTLQV